MPKSHQPLIIQGMEYPVSCFHVTCPLFSVVSVNVGLTATEHEVIFTVTSGYEIMIPISVLLPASQINFIAMFVLQDSSKQVF